MQEVESTLKFTLPCLGYAPKRLTTQAGMLYQMPRDGSGKVIFLPSWWHAKMRYAAKVSNLGYGVVNGIDWAPPVSGTLGRWKRFLPSKGKRQRYALHEAFCPGVEVRVRSVLPSNLQINDFSQLLEVVGFYKGISPFQDDGEAYGTFEVVQVVPIIREKITKEHIGDFPRTDPPIRHTD